MVKPEVPISELKADGAGGVIPDDIFREYFILYMVVLSEFMIIFAPAKSRNLGTNAGNLIINL